MSDQDEIGRPNYTRGGASPAPSRLPAGGPGPREPQDMSLRPWLALAAMLVTAGCWTQVLSVPLIVGLITAILAMRWGLKSRLGGGSAAAVVAANLSWIVAALFILQLMALISVRYFSDHQGFGAAIDILLT